MKLRMPAGLQLPQLGFAARGDTAGRWLQAAPAPLAALRLSLPPTPPRGAARWRTEPGGGRDLLAVLRL